jgi:hypothetical protein
VRLGVVVGLVAVIALVSGVMIGLVLDDDSNNQSTGSPVSDCSIVQVPVSDHVEGLCIPDAAPLFELFDEPSTPVGSTAEGYSFIGELWLAGDGKGLCWVNETNETRCSSPG